MALLAHAAAGAVEGNRLTVRLELQADCFAGVWTRKINEKHGVLEPGDLKEALVAAHQVGDDILQRMGGQKVDESKFTHGTSEQRTRWFQRGYESGALSQCDTFGVDYRAL